MNAAAAGGFVDQFHSQARGLAVWPNKMLGRLIAEPDAINSRLQLGLPHLPPGPRGSHGEDNAGRDNPLQLASNTDQFHLSRLTQAPPTRLERPWDPHVQNCFAPWESTALSFGIPMLRSIITENARKRCLLYLIEGGNTGRQL